MTLLTHPSGYLVDAERGLVYGPNGRAIRRRDSNGYVRPHGARRAHVLVWEAVNGPLPDDLQVNHINSVRDDNRIENLEAVTISENVRHSFAYGFRVPMAGTRNGRAKLTEDDVREIRAAYANRRYGTNKALSERFGIPASRVWAIGTGRQWAHVPDEVAA